MRNNVPSTEYNVGQDQAAHEQLSLLVSGRPSLPVITAEDEVILGFDRGQLEQAPNL